MMKFGLPEHKLIVQTNGIDTAEFHKDEARRQKYRTDLKINTLAVGMVGLVLPERKGVDTFIMLGKTFPEHQFFWFGKIFSSALVAPVSTDQPNVHFTGFVDDILAAINSIDIFVFPSREENQGIAILEAAAVGLPILVRNLPAYEGWLVHEQNCLIAKSEEEFKIHLKRLFEDAELRERLSKAALVLAQEQSLESQMQVMKKIYEGLVSTPALEPAR